MPEKENLESFIKENKKLLREFLEIRAEVYRLRFIRVFSKLTGNFIWMIVSMFLFSLFIIFLGLVAGFYFSELTGNYASGFGLATLCILLLIILIVFLPKTLFINPIIRTIINRTGMDSLNRTRTFKESNYEQKEQNTQPGQP